MLMVEVTRIALQGDKRIVYRPILIALQSLVVCFTHPGTSPPPSPPPFLAWRATDDMFFVAKELYRQ